MQIKTAKATTITGVLVIAAAAAYWHWSPYLAIRQMQSAALEKDADAFNELVDYPKLRESFKSQFSARVTDMLRETKSSGDGFAALGPMLGMAMADQMFDAMSRPETLMRAMQNGDLAAKSKRPDEGPASSDVSPGSSPEASASSKAKPKWAYERKGANKFVAYEVDPEKPDAKNTQRLGVVFLRSGFVDWKLTEIRLPTLTK